MKIEEGFRKLAVHAFDWDFANTEKLQKHRVSKAEVESVFQGEVLVLLDLKHSHQEVRYIGIGRGLRGRKLFVVFTNRLKNEAVVTRIISARYLHKREEDRYEKFKENFEKNPKR
jgi:uncharacterized DUF497 family protein